MSSFVGRREEMAEVKRWLSTTRLVTLTGVGGVGKTRLALRVARDIQRAFRDGVWLVELAALDDTSLLQQTIEEALGLQDYSAVAPRDVLASFLQGKELLLILDNCEHLLQACAALLGKILVAAGQVRVLATSRQSLGLTGEQIFPVSSLSVPPRHSLAEPGESDRYHAVRLFAERATAVVPEFAITADNRAAVWRICRRLDGIPLAIELAAARVRVLSPGQILDRLGDRFQLLTGGSPGALPRHQTLLAAVEWSYELCSDAEKALWARLSIFACGFDLDALESVCTSEDIEPEGIFGLLAGLIDKSIVLTTGNGGSIRYEMPETIREYGRRRLALRGQDAKVRRRHAEHYVRLAERAEAGWFSDRQVAWCDRLRGAHANLRIALEYLISAAGETETALAMIANLWNFWLAGGLAKEASHWIERALPLAEEPTEIRATAFSIAAFEAAMRGDEVRVTELLSEGISISRRFGFEFALARLLKAAAWLEIVRGDYAGGVALYEGVLSRFRALGDDSSVTMTLWELAFVYCLRGADARGDVERAMALCQECLENSVRCGETWSKSYAMYVCGLGLWCQQKYPEAEELTRHSIRLKLVLGDFVGITLCMETLGLAVAGMGDHARAARVFGATAAIRREIGAQPTSLARLRYFCECARKQVRHALGPAAYQAEFGKGAEFSLDQAVDYVLGTAPVALPAPRPAGHTAAIASLTPRERQVAELVARGLSNKEIAAELVIAERTAEGHVERVRAKLGCRSRTEVAARILGTECGPEQYPGGK